MSLRIGTRRETEKKMHTGHFYFAKNRTFLLCVDTFLIFLLPFVLLSRKISTFGNE